MLLHRAIACHAMDVLLIPSLEYCAHTTFVSFLSLSQASLTSFQFQVMRFASTGAMPPYLLLRAPAEPCGEGSPLQCLTATVHLAQWFLVWGLAGFVGGLWALFACGLRPESYAVVPGALPHARAHSPAVVRGPLAQSGVRLTGVGQGGGRTMAQPKAHDIHAATTQPAHTAAAAVRTVRYEHDIYAVTCAQETTGRREGYDLLLEEVRTGVAGTLREELELLQERCPRTRAILEAGPARPAPEALYDAYAAALGTVSPRRRASVDGRRGSPAGGRTLPHDWGTRFGAGPLLYDTFDGATDVVRHCLQSLASGHLQPLVVDGGSYTEYHLNDDAALVALVHHHALEWTRSRGLGPPRGIGRATAELYLREYDAGGAAGLHSDVAEAAACADGRIMMVPDAHDTGHCTGLFYIGFGAWDVASTGRRMWRDCTDAERQFAGGETVFPFAPGWLAVDPRPGSVLFFSSYGADRTPALEGLHFTRVMRDWKKLVLVVDFNVAT